MKPILLAILILSNFISIAQKQKRYNAIYSGISWFDDKGNTVSAHGASIIKDKDKYYLFGERHTDTSNAFVGFNCYSSTDLYNWKFESIALPVQASGKLGPNRVGERPKVMKCPGTGEYVMYMHVDTPGYIDQYLGYATANKITGPYIFHGPLLFNSRPILKWDMGAFQFGFYGLASPTGGYAHVALRNKKGKTIISSIVDMYCKYPTQTLKFLSSTLKNDNYTLMATVMGEHGNWSDKRKNFFGSTGNFVSLDKIVVVE